MALLNIVSLQKHIDQIRLLLINQSIDILALNETRLHADIPNEFINIEGYDLARLGRDRHGGGVFFYVRNSLAYLNRNDLVPDNLEAICLEINNPNSKSFIVSTIYRPPSSSVEIFSCIESLLKNVDNENKEIYLLGDLNCNFLDQSNSSAKHLNSIMQLYQLTQIIDQPTRITESSATLLDVCITSAPEQITFSDVVHVGVTDHSLICVVGKINLRLTVLGLML